MGIRREIDNLTSPPRNRLPVTRDLASLLTVHGRDHDTMSPARGTLARRLWGWFELLPFHRGVLLLSGVVMVPVLVVGGVLALGAGGGTDRATADPVPTHQKTVRVPDLPERTWGQLIPHRRPKPASSATAVRSRTTPRPHPTATTGARSPAATTCPPSMKRWPWMWQLCKRRQGDRAHP